MSDPSRTAWSQRRWDPPIGDHLTAPIGRMVLAFGAIEGELLAVLTFLLGVDENFGRAAFGPLGFSARLDMIQSLAWARWQDDAPLKLIAPTVQTLREAAKERNSYVHGYALGSSWISGGTPADNHLMFTSIRGKYSSIPEGNALHSRSLGATLNRIELADKDLVYLHAQLEDFARSKGEYIDPEPGGIVRLR